MTKRLLLGLLSLIVASVAYGGDLDIGGVSVPGSKTYTVKFKAGDTRTTSGFIDSCPYMAVRFYQATDADVSLYQVDPGNVDPSDGTLVVAYTATSSTLTTFQPGKAAVRFEVDTLETSGTSFAVVTCSNVQLTQGGGGGDLHPATGVDSEIRMGENIDFTTGGVGESVAVVIDSSTDLLQDVTETVSPLGLTGSERMYEAFVNDSGIAAEQEWIEWGVDPEYTCGSTCGTIATGTNPNTANTLLFPLVGGRINLVALSATSMNNNTGTDTYCEYTAYRSNTSAPADFSVTKGTPTDWTACTGTLHTGQNTANTGGVGETDGKVNDDGDHYAIPISDCQCATDDCVIAVAVADEIAGAPGDCDDQHHIHLRAFVTETYP